MIILNKKRLLFINLIIVISIFSLAIKNTAILETSSTPISGHTVILDAGHRAT